MKPHLIALAAIVAAGLVAAFTVRDAVLLDLVFTLLLYAVLGQSWNWISGYAGNVSFGHAIFFACGAYASALCVTHGLSPWLALPLGALAAAALATVTGFPTLALRGHYFSIATIAVAALVDAFVRNAPWFNQANGFELPIASGWGAMQFAQKGPYVVLALALFAAAQLATIALERSRLGYYLRALRANHAAAASVGIGERRWKLIAFAWCAVMASAAGVLYAQYTLFVDPPSTLALAVSIDIALIGVVGGIGTLWGPAVGALVYVVLAKGVALRLGGSGKGYDLVIYGAIICVIAALRPYGIVGTVVDALRRRRGALAAPAAAAAAVLLVVSLPPPLRAAGGDPIDLAVAGRAFADRSAECARDDGRLWGVGLCGPLVFVDPATRATVSNVPSVAMHTVSREGVLTGTLPSNVALENGVATIGSERWSVMLWPLPADPIERRILVMHASWQRIENSVGLPPSNAENAHLDTVDGRYWMEMEWRALARAVTTPAGRRAAMVGDALSFRDARLMKFSDAARGEDALLLTEGMAEDTGIELTSVASDRVIRVVEALARQRDLPSFSRTFADASGPAYGMLLDSALEGWRRHLNARSDLAAMLAAAYHVQHSAAQAVARAPAYDDGGLRVAEELRAAHLAARTPVPAPTPSPAPSPPSPTASPSPSPSPATESRGRSRARPTASPTASPAATPIATMTPLALPTVPTSVALPPAAFASPSPSASPKP